jgi:hypothetical protein
MSTYVFWVVTPYSPFKVNFNGQKATVSFILDIGFLKDIPLIQVITWGTGGMR